LASFAKVLVLVDQCYFPALGNLGLGKVCFMWAMISSLKRPCLRWWLLEELVDVDVVASFFWY